MSAPRLLVTLTPWDEVAAEIERKLPGVAWEYAGPQSTGPWIAVEAMLAQDVRQEIPHWTFEKTPSLKFVQRFWAGLDGFPFERFPPSVQIAGNAGAFAPSVAEHAIALLLALGHEIRANHDVTRMGRLRPALDCHELRGSTVLLLGFGEVATQLALRLRPFGARIHGVSRTGAPVDLAEKMFPASALKEALSEADFAVDCRPLNLRTMGSIDRSVLGSMKPTAIYVNVGRAGTADERALYEHLSTHPRFGAAFDAWWDEDNIAGTIRSRFPFTQLPNFLGSPHVAGYSRDRSERGLAFSLANLARFFSGIPPLHVADRREYVRE